MKTSQNLKNLLEQWEELKQQVYPDTSGRPTIGIGHLITQSERSSGKIIINGQPIKYANWLSVQQCWELLDQDLKPPESAVNNSVKVPLNQNQFDALVSFTYNLGNMAFQNSTLLKMLNAGSYGQIPGQLRRWIHDTGKVVQGLINRREKEIALWKTPITEVPHA
jgi:lysozyme